MELILVLGGVPVLQFTFLYCLLMLLRTLVIPALDHFLSYYSKFYLETDVSCWLGVLSTLAIFTLNLLMRAHLILTSDCHPLVLRPGASYSPCSLRCYPHVTRMTPPRLIQLAWSSIGLSLVFFCSRSSCSYHFCLIFPCS
jgi:hypothetical protein